MRISLLFNGLLLHAVAMGATPVPAGPTPVITEPESVTDPLPPAELLWRGCTMVGVGMPIFSFTVKPDGTTAKHRIVRSCGCVSADRAYIRSIKNWRYKPATQNGKPVPAAVTITISVNWR